MHLFEAIVEASHRAAAGGVPPAIQPAEFAAALPVVALSCIDPRLNELLPRRLGLGAEDFIWLRNAGNVVTSPLSSTTRSLALACAIKGGKEIALIGHSDCRVARTTMLDLTERFRALGIERPRLPENLVEFFGLAGSERQLVLRGVELVRASPLIGPKVPVHGLLLDLASGRFEWVVNGYDQLAAAVTPAGPAALARGAVTEDKLDPIGGFHAGAFDLERSAEKIGEHRAELPRPEPAPAPTLKPPAAGTASPLLRPVTAPPPPVAARFRSWLQQVEIIKTGEDEAPKLRPAARVAADSKPPVLPGRQPPGERRTGH